MAFRSNLRRVGSRTTIRQYQNSECAKAATPDGQKLTARICRNGAGRARHHEQPALKDPRPLKIGRLLLLLRRSRTSPKAFSTSVVRVRRKVALRASPASGRRRRTLGRRARGGTRRLRLAPRARGGSRRSRPRLAQARRLDRLGVDAVDGAARPQSGDPVALLHRPRQRPLEGRAVPAVRLGGAPDVEVSQLVEQRLERVPRPDPRIRGDRQPELGDGARAAPSARAPAPAAGRRRKPAGLATWSSPRVG
jgi:hypothetical protein